MMGREQARRAILWFAVATQVLGGVVAFALFPEGVFTDIGDDALARFTLRLAAYAHASFATLTILALVRSRDATVLRCIAGAGVLYHLPAGVDGLRAATGMAGVVLAEPVFGPVVFHTLMTALLLVAAALPGERPA